jgi:hypothetical protein
MANMILILPPYRLLSTRLGWSISSTNLIPVPAVLKERSGSDLPLPELLPLQAYARENGPSMNMLPTTYPEMRLFGRIDHDTQRFAIASLVLSKSWEVPYDTLDDLHI